MLVTNGGLGYFDPKLDAMGVQWNAMGLLGRQRRQAQAGRPAVGQARARQVVYVGEGDGARLDQGERAFDSGQATIEAASVAGRFWDIYKTRDAVTAEIG